MNQPIYKYRLQESPNEYGRTTAIAAGKILLVAEQQGLLHVWVQKNELVDHVQRVSVFATGEHVPESAKHIGSAKVGQFVWHVYTGV